MMWPRVDGDADDWSGLENESDRESFDGSRALAMRSFWKFRGVCRIGLRQLGDASLGR